MRLLYLSLIALSNVLTAKFNPFILAGGLLVIPVGSLFAGAVFVLRDLVQLKHGRLKTYKLICGATLLSLALSHALGDTAYVAAASMAAFIVSETLDTEIFSRMQAPLAKRVLVSGALGGCLDSTVFVVFGLSPLAADMLPWDLVPFAVLGQTLVKLLVQLLAAVWLTLKEGGRADADSTR